MYLFAIPVYRYKPVVFSPMSAMFFDMMSGNKKKGLVY